MKRNVSILLILTYVTVPILVLAESEELPVFKTYCGIIDILGKFDVEQFEPLLVIRTEQAFADFLSRIPTETPYPSSAPANDDSLLQNPDIDFDKQMLVVVVRASTNTPIIHSVMRYDGRVVIETEFPLHARSRLWGMGTYSAVLIPLAKEEVVVQSIEPNEKDEVQSKAEGDSLEPGPEYHR
jgi:hypothetical protein